MNANEVVVPEVQADSRDVVFQFLAESVREPSKPPHVRTHCEVLAFHVAGGYVLSIRLAADVLTLGSDAFSRTAELLGFA